MVCAPALAAESDKPDVFIFQKTEPDLRPASSSRLQLRNMYLQGPVSSSSFAPRGSSEAFPEAGAASRYVCRTAHIPSASKCGP